MQVYSKSNKDSTNFSFTTDVIIYTVIDVIMAI